jgi:hypothetical protein
MSQVSSPDVELGGSSARAGAGLDRVDAVVAGLVALATFLLYLRTLAPGLLIDDSGEFQAMTRLLGHTHPTGYEVYTVVGRVFSAIPIGEFTSRVSAFSAFTGAITAILLYVLARLLRAPKAISVVPALAIAASPTFWSQAIIAEVYTPAAALGMFVLVGVLLWYRTLRPRWLVVAGVAGGVSLGVHFTIGLYLPAVAAFLLLATRRHFGRAISVPAARAVWLPAIAGASAGIAAALLAFVAVDIADPPSQYFDAVVAPSRSAWGLEPGQIDGPFDRLRFDWIARQFTSLMFGDPVSLMSERFAEFRTTLPTEVALLLLGAAAVGALWLLRRDGCIAALVLVALATHLLYAFNYDIGGLIYVFYIPAYLLIALLASVGLSAVARVVVRIPVPGVTRTIAAAIVGVAALLVGVLPIARQNLSHAGAGEVPPFEYEGYPYNDYVATTLHPALTATVAELPENAIVFTDWELLYPYFYVAHVELGRTDLMFHETYAADDQDGLAASVVDYVREQSATRPVLVSERLPELSAAGFSYVPVRVGPTSLLKVVP